jgi:hypothetical protein
MNWNTLEHTEQDDALSRLLHDEVDHIPLTGDGLSVIKKRLPQRKRLRAARSGMVAAAAVAAVVAVSVAAPHLVAGLDGQTAQPASAARAYSGPEPIWPYNGPAAAKAGHVDPDVRSTAVNFLAGMGLRSDRLTADEAHPTADRATDVRVRLDRGGSAVTLGTVHLVQYHGTTTWGVAGMSSDGLSIRNPKPGDSFDPPLSVDFRSNTAGLATVALYVSGRTRPETTWTESIDADTDWYANANYGPIHALTPGYIVVTAGGPPPNVTAVSVLPIRLGPLKEP